MRRKIQRVADVAASQVHTIQALGEFLDETYSHAGARARPMPGKSDDSGRC